MSAIFSSDLLDLSMFSDNKDINTVFLKLDNELQKTKELLISNKLSLNVKEAKHLNL